MQPESIQKRKDIYTIVDFERFLFGDALRGLAASGRNFEKTGRAMRGARASGTGPGFMPGHAIIGRGLDAMHFRKSWNRKQDFLVSDGDTRFARANTFGTD